ncbi:hypothetical protein M2105_000200 [Paenibacillus sp. PastF-1]|nr:hypothetical protein [Paenibacillus sp. PastF-2]MDF9845785.1 hypothetical protein [Paenibacillus sp. PastM-2]MDF9852358.1 hypothetical protein [Paenibacillus sp. PastF-1]MDH6477912.1 hypothetical protein [Paenibacillus sp. PastH-2]MDH6505651.1 hypothetical protein [Paenibacillus sp. PastM-3]
MKSNVNMLYCLLGSFVLALLNHPVLSSARLGIFPSGYGASLFGVIFVWITDILAFAGYLLLIICSILLFITNINPGKNKNRR